MQKFLFKNNLIEGLIKSRPNRFIMLVEINNKPEKCHCPSTGRIASIKFENIPCLLSISDNPERKTKYTVEAISLDSINKPNKEYIGINQSKANEYIEFFIKTNQLSKIFKNIESIKREVPLGKSRIDFLINNRDYLEVKMPLKDISSETHPNYKKHTTKFNSFDRIIKHFKDISNSISKDSRAIFLLCFVFNAPIFSPPTNNPQEKIIKAAKKARAKGLENWQINLKIDKQGIELVDYFKLNLF